MEFTTELEIYFHYKKEDKYTYTLISVDFTFTPNEDDLYEILTVYYNGKELKNVSEKNMKRILTHMQESLNEDDFIKQLVEYSNECIAENVFDNMYGNSDNWIRNIRID